MCVSHLFNAQNLREFVGLPPVSRRLLNSYLRILSLGINDGTARQEERKTAASAHGRWLVSQRQPISLIPSHYVNIPAAGQAKRTVFTRELYVFDGRLKACYDRRALYSDDCSTVGCSMILPPECD